MYFRQFTNYRHIQFIVWKTVNGRMDSGNTKRFGGGWQYKNSANKQTFKLELIL